MHDGAFFLLDCLGFKGLWNRIGDPDAVLTMLKEIEQSKDEIVAKSPLGKLDIKGKLLVQMAFLSDTVVGGVTYKGQFKIEKLAEEGTGILVYAAAQLAEAISRRFREAPVPLLMRGIIVQGGFTIDGNFILGPAVDEAATLMNVAEGAFVWLSPSADRSCRAFTNAVVGTMQNANAASDGRWTKFESGLTKYSEGDLAKVDEASRLKARQALNKVAAQGFESLTVVWDYPIPIKNGATVRSSVVNPFAQDGITVMKLDQAKEHIVACLAGDTLDIVIKRQNTELFLDRAMSNILTHRSQLDAVGKEVAAILGLKIKNPLP